ncbi:MAG TPA: murein biosynthesis integral membrane protein MurJ [Acidimicrobiales bacterium]|nr:murein biosynthesis integral membrane protein MurJ [Acidimicrobiales bacterium]
MSDDTLPIPVVPPVPPPPRGQHRRSSSRVSWPEALSRTTGTMAVGTLLSRVTGFARVFALAYALGINPFADAYNLANNTPNIIFDLVLGGVLSATLIPVFVDRLATRSDDEAWHAISSVVTLAAVMLVVVTAIFAALAPAIISLYTLANHSAAAPDQRAVATTLLRFFAPQVAFYGAIALITALLNARRRFVAPMFVPILNNIVVIGVLVGAATVVQHPTLNGVRNNYGFLLLLGVGTTAGVVVQAVALLPSLWRARTHLRWRWDPRNETVRTILRLSAWTFGFVLTTQVSYFIVLAIADSLSGGAVTAYNYAYVFFQLPFGIVTVSIMTAVQPALAERWAVGDLAAFRRRLTSGLQAVLALLIPAAVGYLVLAKPVVALVLGHGAAGAEGVQSTASTLALFALGLPGFSTYLFSMRAYQATQDTRTPFFLYLIVAGLNVVLAFSLYHPLGVKGLALAYSIAYTVAAGVALWDLRHKGVGIDFGMVARPVLRVCTISLLMALVVALVSAAIGYTSGVGLLFRVLASVAAGLAVFVLGSGLAAHLSMRRGRA